MRKKQCELCGGTGAISTYSRECDEAGADGARVCSCILEKIDTLQAQLKVAAEALQGILAPQIDEKGNWVSNEEAYASQTKIAREALAKLGQKEGG